MALQLSVTLASGVVATYWKYSASTLNRAAGTLQVWYQGFLSSTVFGAGDAPCAGVEAPLSFTISGAPFSALMAATVTSGDTNAQSIEAQCDAALQAIGTISPGATGFYGANFASATIVS